MRSLAEPGPDWDAVWTFVLSIMVLLLSAGIAFLPALTFVWRTARDCPEQPETAGLILVFGKKLAQGNPDRDYLDRLHKAAEILRDFPSSRAVLMGGSAKAGEVSEADAGRSYLTGARVADGARILLEQESRHTLENLRNTRDRLPAIGGNSILLVSNRYHLARCSLFADSLQMDHGICAAEERLIVSAVTARKVLVEAFFVLWFKTGSYWARLTGNPRMLSRIS